MKIVVIRIDVSTAITWEELSIEVIKIPLSLKG